MKRISTNPRLPVPHATRLLRELRTLRASLNVQQAVSRHSRLASPYAVDESDAKYLSLEEAASRTPRSPVIKGGRDAIRFCGSHFHGLIARGLQEEFHILSLDAAHRVIRAHLISIGLANTTQVHPREVFRPAILDAATAVILVHNRPSGEPTPSASDRKTTARLEEAGELLGITVLDHIVLAREGSVSVKDPDSLDRP